MYGSCGSACEYELEVQKGDDGGDDSQMPGHSPYVVAILTVSCYYHAFRCIAAATFCGL